MPSSNTQLSSQPGFKALAGFNTLRSTKAWPGSKALRSTKTRSGYKTLRSSKALRSTQTRSGSKARRPPGRSPRAVLIRRWR